MNIQNKIQKQQQTKCELAYLDMQDTRMNASFFFYFIAILWEGPEATIPVPVYRFLKLALTCTMYIVNRT